MGHDFPLGLSGGLGWTLSLADDRGFCSAFPEDASRVGEKAESLQQEVGGSPIRAWGIGGPGAGSVWAMECDQSSRVSGAPATGRTSFQALTLTTDVVAAPDVVL